MHNICWKSMVWLVICVVVAGGVPLLIASKFYVSSWSPDWFQAIGSICAVLVAVYVPWKIDKNKKLAEEKKDADLKRLSLKAIGHESWLMKQFFMHSHYALGIADKAALEDFSAEQAPVDSKSPFVLDHGKFSIVANLPDEIATAYMNAVSRRFLAVNHMRSHLSNLQANIPGGSYSRGEAFLACQEGESLCDEIIKATELECAGLRFGLKPNGYNEET